MRSENTDISSNQLWKQRLNFDSSIYMLVALVKAIKHWY